VPLDVLERRGALVGAAENHRPLAQAEDDDGERSRVLRGQAVEAQAVEEQPLPLGEDLGADLANGR
jgi:hypothetical protein